MKKSLGRVWTFILGWIFAILLLIFYIQSKYYYGANPIVRLRQEVVEPFQTSQGEDPEPMTGVSLGDPELAKPHEPYALLGNWLKLTDTPSYKSAKECHEVDFQTRLEKTGNFRQLTNNYKRGDPDSCSGPIQDLTFAIYKTEPIPFGGCA